MTFLPMTVAGPVCALLGWRLGFRRAFGLGGLATLFCMPVFRLGDPDRVSLAIRVACALGALFLVGLRLAGHPLSSIAGPLTRRWTRMFVSALGDTRAGC
jgi:hypothetical protein